jgi:hypothetical protein
MNAPKKKSKSKPSYDQKKRAEEEKKRTSLIRILGGVIALVAAIQFIQTVSYDFVLDDFSAIVENTVTVNGVEAIPTIFKTSYRFGYPIQGDELYRPLTKSIFAVLWQLAPDNPMPGHLLNILLYALTGFLLFTAFSSFLKNLYVPFIAAVLFAVHPIHTDVVPNIKSLDEILSFLFFLLSLMWLHTYLHTRKLKWMMFSGAGYFAALLSKESAITFLAVYPLVIYFFTDRSAGRSLSAAAFMLLPALIFLLIRYKVVGETTPPSMADNALLATKDVLTQKTTAVYILGLYLLKLVYPHPLTFDYSYKQIPLVGVSDWRFLLSFVVYAGIFIYAVSKWKSRDPVAFGIWFFLITLSISSNLFITIGTHMAERLLYVPSFGFCFATAAIAERFIDNRQVVANGVAAFFTGRKLLTAFVAAAVVAGSFVTFAQNPVWRNNMTLYESGVKRSPDSHRTHYYLGLALVKQENYSTFSPPEQQQMINRGLRELRKSVEIYPGFADAWLHIGNYYSAIKANDSAGKYFRKAIATTPYLATAHNNLGTVYFDQQKWDSAIASFSEAVRLDPNYQNAYRNLGSVYGTIGQFQRAIPYFLKAVELAPGDAEANYFLGITYQSAGDEQNAQIYINKAAKLDPKFRK